MEQLPADGARLLAVFGQVGIGVFHCPPDSPRWRVTNNIGAGHHVVFPRRPVRIRQSGGPEFVADPTQVVVYADAQPYDRAPAGGAGDLCHFLVVDPMAVADAPWVAGPAPLSAGAFLRQRSLLAAARRASSGRAVDGLTVEEEALALLAGLRATPPVTRSVPDLVEAAKQLLANTFAQDLRLAELARPLHVSPYHLARVFRSGTGQSLHGYRTELRLRAALDRMAEGDETLADVAVACGFASHSHFTDAFRRRFGTPPARVRAGLAA